MNNIIWSDLAFLSFTDIANYLTDHYSIDAAIKFNEDVENLLAKLESFASLCPKYQPRPTLRKCTINKHSSLIYRIDGQNIQLISFFDNRGVHPY